MFARLCNEVSHIIPQIYRHPFNQELFAGTLPKTTFNFYLHQDAFYLAKFYQAITMTSHKLVSQEHKQKFKKFSKETFEFERSLHAGYIGGCSSSKFFQMKPGIITLTSAASNYSQHLLDNARDSPVEVAVASLVPCFWIYNMLGKNMQLRSDANKPNPYRDWIASYSDPAFTESTESIIRILEDLANAAPSPAMHEKMIKVFVKSAEFELDFWNACYMLQRVPDLEQQHFERRKVV